MRGKTATTATRKRKTPAIPKTSSLRAFVRRGVEGGCMACGKRIAAHVGKQGQWLGCQSPTIALKQPMILVPDRRHLFRAPGSSATPRSTAPALVASSPAPTPPSAPQAVSTPLPRYTHVRYVAKAPLSAPRVKKLTDRDREVYRLIARKKAGQGRKDLLKELHTRRTGVVDGAVRRLRLKKLITVASIAA